MVQDGSHSVSLMLSCRKFILFGIYGCKLWCIECLDMLVFEFILETRMFFTAKEFLLQPHSRFHIDIPYYDNLVLFGCGIFTLPVKYHICERASDTSHLINRAEIFTEKLWLWPPKYTQARLMFSQNWKWDSAAQKPNTAALYCRRYTKRRVYKKEPYKKTNDLHDQCLWCILSNNQVKSIRQCCIRWYFHSHLAYISFPHQSKLFCGRSQRPFDLSKYVSKICEDNSYT